MKNSVVGKLIVAGLALSAIGAAAAQDLTPAQAKARIEAAGYSDVRDVRREGNHFDAKATAQNGKRVTLDVDARTGTVKLEDEGHERRARKK